MNGIAADAALPITVLPEITPFRWRDPKTVEPRGFIYSTSYVRKYLSCTIAPTKTGKTALAITEGLAICTGKPLLDITPRETGNVWFWNGEDPMNDLEARVFAAMKLHHLDQDDVEGKFFLNSGRDNPFIIARDLGKDVEIIEPVKEHLVEHLIENRILVVSIDPFVSSHHVPENDNNKINSVAVAWGQVANRANCAIHLWHHPRKTNGADITAEDGRGAVALISAARGQRTLNRMTEKQAKELNVPPEKRRRHFCISNVDSNLLASGADEPLWHQFCTVDLENGDQEGYGAVTRWHPPGLFDSITTDHLRQIQDRIAAGEWLADTRAKEKWAGVAIATVLGLDKKADKDRIAQVLKHFTATGALVKVQRRDVSSRHVRGFIEVGSRV